VQFSIVYTVSSSNREYGSVTLPGGQNVVELAVQEGTVRVHDASGKRDDQGEGEPFVEKLRIYEDQARSAFKGLWNNSEDSINASYESPEDPQEFFGQYKGSEIDGMPYETPRSSLHMLTSCVVAIVERVISGDRLVVRLILDPKKHRQLLVVLAGIRTPLSTRTDASGMVHPGEEYGDEAKDFVEVRLLQRSVKLSLVGIGQQGQLVANVSHPAGNIAELLLSQGFGRCVDYHSTMIGPSMARYRAAEKHAKDKNLRLFKAHVAKKKDSNNDFDAVVSRIMNADTLYVRNKAGAERRINLSSVRQPKYAFLLIYGLRMILT
jgi:staphylococcal nuclease domain-containing protein 1